jgi:beta-phosphoglucomutase-like phosphatase (HAD superfamily)
MPLNRVLARIRQAAAGRPIAIFDLDSTLLSTQERNWAILQEFADGADGAPGLRPVLERLSPDHMGWNVLDDLRRHGFDDPEALRALRRFWFERFFRDEYLRHDRPLPGAVEFVRDAHREGARVVYMTGRDEPNMGRGTRESLRAHGFPVDDDRVLLRLKPRFEEPDLAFKRAAVEEIRGLGEVIAAFENEPANANLFAEAFPTADVLFLETVHSPDPPPLAPRIVRLKDFRR